MSDAPVLDAGPAPGAAPGPRLITFGCRLNSFESEVMRNHARTAGLSDVVIVNTCAVTSEAERQARQAIRRARREHPAARLIVTGCAAEIAPERYRQMPEVNQVVGNVAKLLPQGLIAEGAEGRAGGGRDAWDSSDGTGGGGDPAAAAAAPGLEPADGLPVITGFEGRTRAFVQVQQGCDHRCTFCIIPLGRGRSRSLAPEQVIAQVQRLVEGGYREVVLTGVDLTAWGADCPGRPRLGDLVAAVLNAVPALARLRLSSLDPHELATDQALLEALACEPRLMPHLHLSIQAGDDQVLRRMARRHRRDQTLTLSRQLRDLRPDLTLGADLIAGFPTETEAQFAETLALIPAAGLVWLHVFPYSARPGTPAAGLPQLPAPVRRERAARLRATGEATARDWLDTRVGQTVTVLVEDGTSGRSEHYAPVQLDQPRPPGEIVPVQVTARDGARLTGRPA